MNNPFKEHSGKIAIFIVNSLLVTVGMLAIKNKDDEKKVEIPIVAQDVNNDSQELLYLPALKVANENLAADTGTVKTQTEKNIQASKSSGTIASKSSTTAKSSSTSSKTSSSSSSTKSAATSVSAPAPKPAPAPAPAKTTKTS